MQENDNLVVDETNVVQDVWEVRKRMEAFSDGIRAGNITGHTGKKLKNIVAIGIGGSFLGPEFVYEALRQEPEC